MHSHTLVTLNDIIDGNGEPGRQVLSVADVLFVSPICVRYLCAETQHDVQDVRTLYVGQEDPTEK